MINNEKRKASYQRLKWIFIFIIFTVVLGILLLLSTVILKDKALEWFIEFGVAFITLGWGGTIFAYLTILCDI